jgi:hypothetical protein
LTQAITLRLEIPQSTIKISVEYYDADEEAKLAKYPTKIKMDELVKNGVDIPIEEFLTYYLFHKKRPGKDGWKNYDEIGNRFSNALAELDTWIEFNGDSISTPLNVGDQDKNIIENIGESIGLSVINRLHDLTHADWNKIPIKKVKSFDYEIASDGNNIIQMEAKGSAIEDNSKKTSTISNHKASILGKKQFIESYKLPKGYPYPADIRYGTITVMGKNSKIPVKCLLVDPPANENQQNPRNLKIIQRIKYLRDWISFISPRSQLASALQTRAIAIEQIENPMLLDGIPLLKGNGEIFDFSPISGQHSWFFNSKSKVIDGPAGGIIVPLGDNRILFLGIREDILTLASEQNFEKLLLYKAQFGRIKKSVNCVVTHQILQRLKLPNIIRVTKSGNYYSFVLSGVLHYTDSGEIFGILNL